MPERPIAGGSSQDFVKPTLPNSQWWFYAIGIIGGLISLFLWYGSILQSDRNLKHIIALQAEHIASDIKSQFELRISALKHIAKHLEEGPDTLTHDWQTNVSEFVNNYGEFKAIGLLDSSLKTLLITPNTSEIKQSYTLLINNFANTIRTLSKMNAWISPPINQVDSKNIYIVIPVFLPKATLPSYLAAIVDLKNILNLQLNHEDYLVTVYANDQIVYQDPAPSKHRFKPEIVSLNINGNLWRVYVEPSTHLASVVKTDLSSVAMILGISIAILFVLTTHFAQLARKRARAIELINHDLQMEVAERIEAQDSKQKLEKELFQGQKLQAIGTLAGGIAHDFNNILYAIMGYVDMAREDVPINSLVYNNLGKVLEASQRGQELIARILAFSRRQQIEFRPIAIRSMIESALGLLKPAIPASVTINVIDNLTHDFTILGDQTRLHQVIVNLINNAVDAMDGEGTVTIRLNIINSHHALLQQFTDKRSGNYCKMEITDTGHGMDHQTIARIFEPFFTTKEVGKGTGLGLATVHNTVKEHHGEILVTSQLGHGATFIVLLPEYKKENITHG